MPSTLTGTINRVAKPYVSNTSYTALGQLMRRFYGAGGAGDVRRFYTYEDTTGRLSSAQAYQPTAVQDQRKILQWNSFVYDDIGNIVRADERSGTVIGDQVPARDASECFKYDKLNRLTEAWTTLDTACAATPAAGTAKGVEPYHRAWTYDTIGNRLTETNKLTATTSTRTYSYPSSGPDAVRPHAATEVTEPGVTTPDSFDYDAAGNTIERKIDGVTSTFAWDHFGRLDHADTQRASGGSTVTEQTSYVYDADGERLIRREPGNTVLYLGGMELRLTTEGQGKGAVNGTRYYSQGGAPVAVRTVGGLHWVLNNAQSSAEVAVDADTGEAIRRRYLPFGGDRSVAGTIASWPSERGFLNKTKDSTTGLSHLGAREYDSTNGRFLTPDPLVQVGKPQSTAYAYAGNNPIAFSDPSGLSECRNMSVGSCNGDPYPYPNDGGSGNGTGSNNGGSTGGRSSGGSSRSSGGTSSSANSAEHTQVVVDELLRDLFVEYHTMHPPRQCANQAYNHANCMAAIRGVRDGSLTAGQGLNYIRCGATVCARGSQLAWELTGIPDAIRCSQGNGAACAWSAASVIPLTRLLRAFRIAARAAKAACSFHPDTLVLLSKGKRKKIKDVKIGDHVVAANESTGKQGGHRIVTRLYAAQHNGDLVELVVASSDGATHVIRTTAEHPFWDKTAATWVPASQLLPGHDLVDVSGRPVLLADVQQRPGASRMLNLTVADLHTYYVLAGDTPVLVHNTCPPAMLDDMSEAYVRGKHMPGGANVTPDKSLFSPGTNLDQLVERANACACRGPNAAGFFERDVDSGTIIGNLSERSGGLPTTWYRVVQDQYGGVISMHPIPAPGG